MTYVLYVLRSVETKEIRYVGQTKQPLALRFAAHRSEGMRGSKPGRLGTAFGDWFLSLKGEVEAVEVCRVSSIERALFVENCLISYCLGKGKSLFNKKGVPAAKRVPEKDRQVLFGSNVVLIKKPHTKTYKEAENSQDLLGDLEMRLEDALTEIEKEKGK